MRSLQLLVSERGRRLLQVDLMSFRVEKLSERSELLGFRPPSDRAMVAKRLRRWVMRKQDEALS